MFSVPLSIAIFAPADTANHSTGTPSSLGEVEGGDDAPALGLGERAERVRRVAEHGHPQHPLRVAIGDVADEADHDAGRIVPEDAVDRREPSVIVEVVLDERPGRAAGVVPRAQELDDLGRVREPAPAGGDDAPRAFVERLDRPVGRVVDLDHDLAPGGGEEAQHARADGAVGVAHAPVDQRHLQPEPVRDRGEPGHHGPDLLGREVDHLGPYVEEQAVPVQPPTRLAMRLEGADPLEGLDDHALELREADDPPILVAHRREVAHLGDREQPLVAGVGTRDPVEEVDVLDR